MIIDSCAIRRDALTLLMNSHVADMRFYGVGSIEDVDLDRCDTLALPLDEHASGLDQALTALKTIRKTAQITPVAILVREQSLDQTLKLLHNGYSGVISLCLDLDLFFVAFRLIGCGGMYIPRDVLEGLRVPPKQQLANRRTLTVREEQILGLIKEGRPNKIIAHQLSISECTVKCISSIS